MTLQIMSDHVYTQLGVAISVTGIAQARANILRVLKNCSRFSECNCCSLKNVCVCYFWTCVGLYRESSILSHAAWRFYCRAVHCSLYVHWIIRVFIASWSACAQNCNTSLYRTVLSKPNPTCIRCSSFPVDNCNSWISLWNDRDVRRGLYKCK